MAYVIMEVTDSGYNERAIEIALNEEAAINRVRELNDSVNNEDDWDYSWNYSFYAKPLPTVGE